MIPLGLDFLKYSVEFFGGALPCSGELFEGFLVFFLEDSYDYVCEAFFFAFETGEYLVCLVADGDVSVPHFRYFVCMYQCIYGFLGLTEYGVYV